MNLNWLSHFWGQVQLLLYVQDMAMTADGKTLYLVASNAVFGGRQDAVYVVDTATNKLKTTMTASISGGACAGIRLSPDETKLFLSCFNTPHIQVIDIATGNLVTTYIGYLTFDVAFSRNGKKMYIPHADSGIVDVIDLATANQTNTVTVGAAAFGMILNSAGTQAYVSSWVSNFVSVMDLATEKVVAKITTGSGPMGMALTVLAPDFALSSTSLSFAVGANQSSPPAQSVNLTLTQTGTFSWSAMATTASGGNWLSVSPSSGTAPAMLSVTANTTGLAAGKYTGTITVTVPNTGSGAQTIAVTLTVGATGTIALSAPEVDFQGVVGAPAPASQSVPITNGASGTLNWSASVSGASWLSVSPSTGAAPGTLTLKADPTGLAAGSYQATVTITSSDATNSPQTLKVVYTLAAGPTIPDGGVVHAATFAKSAPLSAGALISIFGSNIGPATPAGAVQVPLPTSLGGVQVLIGGVAAPLVYVSAGQINCQIPYEVAGKTTATVVVQNGTASSPPATITLAAAAPGIFTATIGTRTQGAVLNKDNSLNTPGNPARPGEVIQIFATGHGPLTITPASGAGADGTQLSLTVETPTVLIGGQTASLPFSGLTPGAVGLWQVNAIVPGALTPGDSVSLQMIHGGVLSNSVIIAVAAQ